MTKQNDDLARMARQEGKVKAIHQEAKNKKTRAKAQMKQEELESRVLAVVRTRDDATWEELRRVVCKNEKALGAAVGALMHKDILRGPTVVHRGWRHEFYTLTQRAQKAA